MPLAQTSPALQTPPHLPQLALSVLRLTQVPEQLDSPAWQATAQALDEQTSPALQVLAHDPQL